MGGQFVPDCAWFFAGLAVRLCGASALSDFWEVRLMPPARCGDTEAVSRYWMKTVSWGRRSYGLIEWPGNLLFMKPKLAIHRRYSRVLAPSGREPRHARPQGGSDPDEAAEGIRFQGIRVFCAGER